MLTPEQIELLPFTSVKSLIALCNKELVTDRLTWKLQLNGNFCGIVIALILTQTPEI
jgi:putative lipoic acid-binding regulatory protein